MHPLTQGTAELLGDAVFAPELGRFAGEGGRLVDEQQISAPLDDVARRRPSVNGKHLDDVVGTHAASGFGLAQSIHEHGPERQGLLGDP